MSRISLLDERLARQIFRRRLAQWPSSAFSPSSLSSKYIWYKAQSESYADNDPVGTATDLSGNARNATAAGSARPTFKTAIAAFNGKSVYRFSADDALSLGDWFTGLTDAEAFIVLNVTSEAPLAQGRWDIGSGTGAWHPFNSGGTSITDDFGCNAQQPSGGETITYSGVLTDPRVFSARVHGTRYTMRLDGVRKYTNSSVTIGWTTTPKIGTNSGFFLTGDVPEFFVASPSLTPQERADLLTYLGSENGLTIQPHNQVVFEGDSITAGGTPASVGVNDTYADRAAIALATSVYYSKNAGSGNKIADLVARAATTDAKYDEDKLHNILHVYVGTNDVIAGTDAATIKADLKSYCQARQAVGWKVVVGTILPSSINAGYNAIRNSVNTLIRGDASFYDGLSDFAGNSTMGDDGDELNATYYDASDTLHPTNAGHDILKPIAQAAISALL